MRILSLSFNEQDILFNLRFSAYVLTRLIKMAENQLLKSNKRFNRITLSIIDFYKYTQHMIGFAWICQIKSIYSNCNVLSLNNDTDVPVLVQSWESTYIQQVACCMQKRCLACLKAGRPSFTNCSKGA